MGSDGKYVRKDRLAGGLVGLLLGDAIGVPYEFHGPDDLPPFDEIDVTPPPDFIRAHIGTPPGTWSDDGAQALCLLESLVTCGRLDLGDFASRLVQWAAQGHLAVDGRVFDIGLQTQRALDRLRAGKSPETAGPCEERDNGNGALMRVLPLALWHTGTDDDLIDLAMRQSLPTHGHLRSQLCCAIYCLFARALLNDADRDPSLNEVFDVLGPLANRRGWGSEWGKLIDELQKPTQGSGYVADSLMSAFLAFDRGHDFASVVRHAIAFGNDTDTTAALAGGLAGLRWGLYGIPAAWREALRGREQLNPLLESLFSHHGFGTVAAPTVRTCESHPLQIGTLTLHGGGRIGVTFCPGKHQRGAMTGVWERDLDTDLAAIRSWGAQHLVTLIEEHEFQELNVGALPQRATAHGLAWHHAAIVDGSVPEGEFEETWATLGPTLRHALADGGAVVVHCKGGLGRAGTVATRLLLEMRECLTASEAMRRVRTARPDAIETAIQEQYLEGLARQLADVLLRT